MFILNMITVTVTLAMLMTLTAVASQYYGFDYTSDYVFDGNYTINKKYDKHWVKPGDECIKSFTPVDNTLFKIVPDLPLDWFGMDQLCKDEHPGTKLLKRYDNFTAEEAQLCGTQIVPFGVVFGCPPTYKNGCVFDQMTYLWDFEYALQDSVLTNEEQGALNPKLFYNEVLGAFDMQAKKYVPVSIPHKFECGICQFTKRINIMQRLDIKYREIYDSIETLFVELSIVSKEDITDLTLIQNNGSMTLKMIQDLVDVLNGSALPLPYWTRAQITSEKKAEVFIRTFVPYHDLYNLEFGVVDFSLKAHVNKPIVLRDFASVTVSEVLSWCVTTNSMVFADSAFKELYQPSGETAYMKYDSDTYDATIVECAWNYTEDRAMWMPAMKYTTEWTPCKGDELFPNEVGRMVYAKKLKKLAYRTNSLADITFMIKLLFELITGVLMLQHSSKTLIGHGIYVDLELMLLNYIPTDDDEINMENVGTGVLFHLSPVKIDDPVLGVAYISNVNRSRDSCKLLRFNNAVNLTNDFILVGFALSGSLFKVFDKVTYMMVTLGSQEFAIIDDDESTQNRIYALIFVTLYKSNHSDDYKEESNHYIDFRNNGFLHTEDWVSQSVASWDFVAKKWTTSNCSVLKTSYFGNIVTRCKHLFQSENGSILRGYYVAYNSIRTTSQILSLTDKLKIALGIEFVFSSFGVLSIVSTGLLFPKWRSDLGHKMMLNMTSALLCNLVLGYVSSLNRLDYTSIKCVIIGALKHYSFLSMFLWMLVMSFLQYLRLSTITGATTITHLLFKVCLFAWGLPLLPVTVLLVWDYEGFYMVQTVDRGYCYPEGIPFTITVVAPAILILILNLIIFVLIINDIYKCCGKVLDLKRHGLDDRKARARNLFTSIFIFFLFGFSWVFNILSELEVIKNQTLFDYLFLMTATFHVFMLSLFFVFLEPKTREYWSEWLESNLYCCLGGVNSMSAESAAKLADKQARTAAIIVEKKMAEIRTRVARNEAAASARASRAIAASEAYEMQQVSIVS